jgi:hypothetical protein
MFTPIASSDAHTYPYTVSGLEGDIDAGLFAQGSPQAYHLLVYVFLLIVAL